ncbi:Ycf4 domain-containing protein, partial [Cephalotus follicularis]
RFDRKEGIVCIFRWGFPGKNRRIFLRFLMKDIQSIRIEVKEGIYARRVLYMEIRGQGAIPLTRTDENLTRLSTKTTDCSGRQNSWKSDDLLLKMVQMVSTLN